MKIDSWARQALDAVRRILMNSAYLTNTEKEKIERLFDEIYKIVEVER